MISSPSHQKPPQLRTVEAQEELRVRAPEHMADLLAEKIPEDQVAGLIPHAAIVILFGDANVGKTFFALDLAAAVATGRQFAGRRTRQGAALYIVAEGQGGFTKRLRALVQKYPELTSAPFRVLRQGVNIREMVDDVLIRVRDFEEDAGSLGLIIIDTLSQTLFGEENSGQDIAAYVAAAGRLAVEVACPVLVLHHQGKDAGRGMRGSSALRGNVDVVIHLRDGKDSKIATTDPAQGGKCRDDEVVTLGFVLKTVGVGRNAGGADVTSCILEYVEPDADAEKRKPPVTGAARRLLMELASESARSSTRHRDDGTPLIRRADLEAAWAATKKATNRGKQASPSYMSAPLADLINAGYLTAEGGDLWFPP